MVNFKKAIRWLSEGKKVTRPCWQEESYWVIGKQGTICWKDNTPAQIHLNQIEALDFEIYEDELTDEVKSILRKRIKEIEKGKVISTEELKKRLEL